ncbi:MAG: PQQ-like beta-propeller repeat protein [Kiritimatiellales bacterium]|nr:PQQ-like beta-propeller repeat protein [Kiritimatiellales bacterium]
MKTEKQILDEFCAEIRSECVPDGVFQTLERVIQAERGTIGIIRFRRVALRAAASVAVLLGLFYGISALTGSERSNPWKVAGISTNRLHKPIVRNRRVITLKADEADLHVAVLDKASGGMLWKSSFPVTSNSIGADKKRVFAWSGEALVAMDAKTGAELWRYETDTIFKSLERNLAVIGNTVCWTEAGRIHAVNTGSGQLAWERKTGAGKLSAPVGNRNSLYAVTKGRLLAFDRKTGEPKWEHKFQTRGIRLFDPLVECDKNGVYVAQRGFFGKATLARIDSSSGETKWNREIHGTLQSLSVKGNIYVKTDKLEVFDGTSGNPLWTAPAYGCAPPTAADGRVYVVEGRGSQKIRALDVKTGHPLWTKQLADSCNGLIVSGDMAFLNGHDGVLYALEVDNRG